MSARITDRDLNAVCERVNRAFGMVDDYSYWERTSTGSRQRPGVFYVDGAYGGVALYRTCDLDEDGESHGVSDVFRAGHMPKRELYDRMQAFLDGIEHARRAGA